MAGKKRPLGLQKIRKIMELITEARDSATLTRAEFGKIGVDAGAGLPLTDEKAVTDFIRDRTRLYRESWVLGPLEEAMLVLAEHLGGDLYLRDRPSESSKIKFYINDKG